jgi:hypothetical protein
MRHGQEKSVTTFPGAPRLLKAGIVLVDPNTASAMRVITLQYNPETLSRSLQPQAVKEGGDRSEATRLLGPPVETFKFDSQIDATDQLEFPDQNPNAVQVGIQPQLSALEMIVYPDSAHLLSNNAMADRGMLEILPMVAPLPLFVWSKKRVVPVRITDFSITEEFFDTTLNPIRAKVSLGLRVLSVTDLGFDKSGQLYMTYQQNKEQMATLVQGAISLMGIGGVS